MMGVSRRPSFVSTSTPFRGLRFQDAGRTGWADRMISLTGLDELRVKLTPARAERQNIGFTPSVSRG